MNADLIAKLEAGVQLLTQRNQDRCAEDNGIGWNGRDQGLGHSLAHQVGQWSSGQIKAAAALFKKKPRPSAPDATASARDPRW